MDFFVNTSDLPNSHRVLRTKEELFEYLSELIDKSAELEATYFDLFVNTNIKKED
jgi:hypothetical protein